MEYDSESSCEGRLQDLETLEECQQLRQTEETPQHCCKPNSVPWRSFPIVQTQPKLKLSIPNKTLSSQVMEYYQKYAQSSNLNQYFSLPTSSTSSEAVKYYYSIYELNPKSSTSRQDCIGEEYKLQSYVPRERRRWVRPPLIGQSASTETPSRYVQPLTDLRSPSPDLKHIETITEEKNDSHNMLPENTERKASSPTSSIASHKPLEWDSGADVGYCNTLSHSKKNNKKLSTIERMALARGCSAALRLDPEGTTESTVSGKVIAQKVNSTRTKSSMIPDANSTPLVENISGSESEIEITPILKNHLPGKISGNNVKSEEKYHMSDNKQQKDVNHSSDKSNERNTETPKSSLLFKVPSVKYVTEGKKDSSKRSKSKENVSSSTSLLKKSTSMNTLTASSSNVPLKRSQSELNLHGNGKTKVMLPLIFNSTSSIATVVNKPTTCDKVIQTSLNTCTQESIGVQVSDIQEETPPLPKRGTSLHKTLHSILKHPKGKTQNSQKNVNNGVHGDEEVNKNKGEGSSSELSQTNTASNTPQPDEAENVTGRANSFEYFPGHIYENVPNGSESHVSSVDTGNSNSTLPNTSSSINEKLWGDSDSLVRDLERSVNILRTLVDANKCDKQVKKRLIHHVVKRLATAKYADDKIEHDLEDNVPWNPDDARRKIYRAEILRALAKKNSTSDSSDDWKPQKEDARQKLIKSERHLIKDVTLESSNSDKFDKNTDRTEMDGRKARMGLRTDDCPQSSNVPSDPDKTESSECFFPQRGPKGNKVKNIFCMKQKCVLPHGPSTTTNSTPPDRSRILLNAIVNNVRTPIESSNNTENNVDWRLPTTLSERQFELKKCSNSDSGDSKLVSYAEMEKRNQLIWITNEISHLCNLKKLLEQPRKLERPRSSPRKAKSAHYKQKPVPLAHTDDAKYIDRSASDVHTTSVDDQWSSHCNLATCHSMSNETNNVARHVRKRNSCAQTATDTTSAHSKTGGEVVCGSMPQTSKFVQLINTGVQTSEDASTLTAMHSDAQHIQCPVHEILMHLPNSYNKCVGQMCQCHKRIIQTVQGTCTHCLQSQRHRLDLDHSKESKSQNYVNDQISVDVTHHCLEETGVQYEQKETKNQINTKKSKCMCDCNATSEYQCGRDCKHRMNGKVTEQKGISPNICQFCSSQIDLRDNHCIAYEREQQNVQQKKHYAHQNKCTCANICECSKEASQVKKNAHTTRCSYEHIHSSNDHISSFKNQKDVTKPCECSKECACDKKQEQDLYSKVFCDCCSSVKNRCNKAHHVENISKTEDNLQHTRPRYLSTEDIGPQQFKVQSSPKCNCNKDCSCENKAIQDQRYKTKESTKPNYANDSVKNDYENGCQYCHICGMVYQNAKKCSCQSHPKAIAYELSFTKENYKKKDVSNVNTLHKELPSNTTKSDNCACEITQNNSTNRNSQQKNTLQDYLSKNKPEFLGNAEIRRQYMSEISHLRQLRKEKRIQLLAMASTSTMIKPSKSSRATVSVQRKITDTEMKERLRKRYLKLNEVRLKRRQQERQEEARRNKLMAKIFCKKLQQKVLKGQVDLSQSVSVISNL